MTMARINGNWNNWGSEDRMNPEQFNKLKSHKNCAIHTCEIRECVEEIERLQSELKEIAVVANKYNWNGVTNSKILSVFLERELAELATTRAELDGVKRATYAGNVRLEAENTRLRQLLKSSNIPKFCKCNECQDLIKEFNDQTTK